MVERDILAEQEIKSSLEHEECILVAAQLRGTVLTRAILQSPTARKPNVFDCNASINVEKG